VIPGGQLGGSGFLKLRIIGDHLNNSGGGTGFNIRVYLGATKLYDEFEAFTASPNRQAWNLDFTIANLFVANSQAWGGHLSFGNAAAPVTLGLGGGQQTGRAAGGFAVDTTVAQTLRVSIQHSAALASLSVRRYFAVAELL
jgi:hypothetical protein